MKRFNIGDYIYWPGRGVYALVIGQGRDRNYKVITKQDMTPKLPEIHTYREWHPVPVKINVSDVPARVKALIEKRYHKYLGA